MKRKICSVTCMVLVTFLFSPTCFADNNKPGKLLKQQERLTVSLELEFTKKEQNALEHAISVFGR
jgi:hypothetical protein